METKEEKKRKYMVEYRRLNAERIKEQRRQYRQDNKDKIQTYQELYLQEKSEEVSKQRKGYRQNNKQKIQNYQKEYIVKNKDSIKESRRKYFKHKLETCNLFNLKNKIRLAIIKSFTRNGLTKTLTTQNILGCTFEEFKNHMEYQFEHWMNWDNRGLYNGTLNYGWDIDHIIPLSTAKTEDDIIRLNHYTNLQPLCSYYNRNIKKDSLEHLI